MFEREVSLDELKELLTKAPIVADIHPVSLCFLDDVKVTTIDKLIHELDTPKPSVVTKTLVVGKGDERFLRVKVIHDPFTPELNKIILDKFDEISKHMLKQSEIAEKIESEADTDVIMLYIVDGLSYWNVKQNPPSFGQVTPCLVDVPTLTRLAFPNIIGDPPLAERLFDKGYVHRIGFSHWSREDNELTDKIFRIALVHKVSDFSEIVRILKSKLRPNTFVQIVREGFDEFTHKQRRLPPIKAILEAIYDELNQLIRVCEELQLTYRIYLTADHGILWRNEFEPQIIENCGKCHPRYSNHPVERSKLFIVEGKEYYCLEYPKIRRPLRNDEWGVHGGISFQESIVPLIEVVKCDAR